MRLPFKKDSSEGVFDLLKDSLHALGDGRKDTMLKAGAVAAGAAALTAGSAATSSLRRRTGEDR